MISLTPESCGHALQMLSGAISEANRQGFRQCVAALQNADAAIRQHGPRAAAQADALLVEAMDHAGSGR